MGSPPCSIQFCKKPEFWRWKLWDLNFVPFDSGNIHIEESKKSGFTFSFELRINSKILRVISGCTTLVDMKRMLWRNHSFTIQPLLTWKECCDGITLLQYNPYWHERNAVRESLFYNTALVDIKGMLWWNHSFTIQPLLTWKECCDGITLLQYNPCWHERNAVTESLFYNTRKEYIRSYDWCL